MNRELEAFFGAFNLNARHARRRQLFIGFDGLADFDVFVKIRREVFIGVPLSVPRLDDAEAYAVRMYLLTQTVSLLRELFFVGFFADDNRNVRSVLQNAECLTARAGVIAFDCRSLVDETG